MRVEGGLKSRRYFKQRVNLALPQDRRTSGFAGIRAAAPSVFNSPPCYYVPAPERENFAFRAIFDKQGGLPVPSSEFALRSLVKAEKDDIPCFARSLGEVKAEENLPQVQ